MNTADQNRWREIAKHILRELRALDEAVRTVIIGERPWRDISNRLLDELRSINTTLLGIQKQIGSIRDQQEASDSNKRTDVTVPPTRIEIQSFPPVPNEERAYQKDKRSRARIKFHVEWITLLVLAIYTGFTGYQVHLTRRVIADNEDSFKKTLLQMEAQTTAQQGSTKTMQDALSEQKKGYRDLLEVNRRLLQMSQATAQEAARTAASVSRDHALFSIGGMGIPPKPEAGKELMVTVFAFNYGMVPAIDAKIAAKCFVKNEALDVFYDRKHFSTLPPPTEGGVVVGAFIGSFFRPVPCGIVSVDDIKQIPTTKFPITIAGDIYYIDTSGQTTHAEFCTATLTGGLTVSACVQHNNTEANPQGKK